jgi:signal transduction histidine kinase/DNA-binding NarL/FixJ family response regulator
MVDPQATRGERLLARLPLGRTIRLALIGLTLALALIAALGIGNLYSARQDYEDELALAYQLESSASAMLAAGVVEEAALRRRGPGAAAARERAADGFDDEAQRALALAEDDAESRRLVGARIAGQRRVRRIAARPRTPARERELANAIFAARETGMDLQSRQDERRSEARDRATDSSRTAIITAVAAGALALLGALGLVAALIGSIRNPLESLVQATGRLAGGELEERVEPAGPQELRDLGGAFNAMAEELGTAQQRIEEERLKLAVTIESLGDALVVTDSSGVVTAVNPRAREVVPELEPGARAGGESSPLPSVDQALAGEVMREQGDRTFSITAAHLGEDGSEGTVWTIRDVSERARLEKVKSDFVATASHELRSPLTSIKGFVELLGRSGGLGEREREFVDVILQSTDRLVDLVNDLLDVARLEAGKMEVHPRLFDMAEVVREVATLMAPRLAEKEQTLDVRVPPNLPRAIADPGRVRQIVTNLLSNAHLYTDQGGRLAVEVAAVDGELELSVSDDGRGMTPDEVDQAFDRFVRRDDGVGGTGLGLSIVKSLVDLQRGSIEVTSAPGEGSTFRVRLPAEVGEAGRVDPREAIRGKRVLVVDDEPDIARLIAEQLGSFGVIPEVAYSGEEALERMQEDHFDAVTLDILMPGRSGMEVLRAIREDEDLRRTPVVIVSILSTTQALFGEWKVSKPIDPEELADALGSAVLAGRTNVLVVGRSVVRSQLEPALVRLGLDHEWVTSAAAAARACGGRRFEIALVDAGMRSPEAVLRALDLRGRRLGRAVMLFSAGDETPGLANLGAEPVPVEDAAGAVLQALSQPLD